MTPAHQRGPARCRALVAAAALAGGLLAGAGAGQAGASPASATATATATAGSGALDRAPAPPCRSSRLVANSAERLGPAGIRITVLNEGPRPCVLKGHPTIALAGQGSPDRNKPLRVNRQGTARAVQLPVGGAAQTVVTFAPVLGEADGYCAAGGDPFVAPSMVVGVAGGMLQLAPDDGGEFALCGDSVRATAFRAVS
ncbi:DUF4232 domain-containing protein [Streptomyces sp. NPDC090022]|uniref:DUF4232 domain-containing protein n=1 Tax=Streptomyces sp. NPDC090022 TaxID=3365920 RepID=UPI0038004C65